MATALNEAALPCVPSLPSPSLGSSEAVRYDVISAAFYRLSPSSLFPIFFFFLLLTFDDVHYVVACLAPTPFPPSHFHQSNHNHPC